MRRVSGVVSMGLGLGGGIASVTRSFVSALTALEETSSGDKTDVPPLRLHSLYHEGVSDLEELAPASFEWRTYGGSRIRTALGALKEQSRGSYVAFDHIGLARLAALHPWGHPYCVWVYGSEVESLEKRMLATKALRRADKIIAISQWTQDTLCDALPEVRGRTQIVRPCIEPARERKWRGLSGGNLTAEGPTALIVGTMSAGQAGKGHEELIRLWPRVRSEVEGARLLIVGDGSDRARLESLGHGVEGIKFLGLVDDSYLAQLYRMSHVFVMPSRQEGFGIVYAEAMWHGLPCIASRIGGARAAVRDGETGILVDPDDESGVASAIVSMLTDADRTRRMGERSREHAEEVLMFSRFYEDIAAIFG